MLETIVVEPFPLALFSLRFLITLMSILRGQRSQGLSKGFSTNTIKKGINFSSSEEERDEVERDEGIGCQHMEVEDLEIPPHVDPNF